MGHLSSQLKTLKELVKDLIPNALMINRLPVRASNSILFTFDDGPHETLTPLIIDILEEYHIQAIFFVVGRSVHEKPHLLKLIANKGHYIGNHSYEHPNGPLPSLFAYRRDILKCQYLVKNILGIDMSFFRPPRGIISPKTLLSAKSCRLRSVLWSSEGGEWGNRKTSDSKSIAKALIKEINPRDIILLHDNNPKVPDILRLLLPIVRSRNFDLKNSVRYLNEQ